MVALAISRDDTIIVSAHLTEFYIYIQPTPGGTYDLHSQPAVPMGTIVSMDLTG